MFIRCGMSFCHHHDNDHAEVYLPAVDKVLGLYEELLMSSPMSIRDKQSTELPVIEKASTLKLRQKTLLLRFWGIRGARDVEM
jgi:hypothetical protein